MAVFSDYFRKTGSKQEDLLAATPLRALVSQRLAGRIHHIVNGHEDAERAAR